jgi:phosphoglycolate phosphatase-like HAD superfamily hydrolase
LAILALSAPALARPLAKRPRAKTTLKKHARRLLPRLSVRPSGQRLCRRELRRIRRETRRGRRVCVVFDIDNTLVDTRHRTLAAVKAFAAANPKLTLPKPLAVRKMRYDGALTGKALGFDASTRSRLASFWGGFFWNPKHFAHDKPIGETVRLAHAAKAAGAEVFYLTGRVATFAPSSVQQLASLGLPDADKAHVLCKPSVKVRTADYKRSELQKLQRRRRVAWFASDAKSDIAAAAGLGIGCVLVDFPVGPARDVALPARTPRLHPKL